MPYVKRPSEPTLHYELDDYTDPWKNAPVILLQHGFSRNARFWYSWVPYLSRFYRVIRPDLRGLGLSERPTPLENAMGAQNYLSDLIAILDHAGVEKVHFCGESLGGVLGLLFAAQHPQRVRTLSLISAPVYISDHDKTSTTYGHGSRIEALRKMGARAWALASNSGRRFPAEADPGLLQWYVDEMGKADVETLVAMFSWVSSATTVPHLASITAPVMGIYPTQGPITDETQIALLKEHVKNLRLIRIASQYHALQNLVPATCADQVLHFAAECDGLVCHE